MVNQILGVRLMRKFISLLVVLAFSIGGLIAISLPAQAVLGSAVFFVPHQDDETLTMGADIRAHYLAGRDIRIVDVTDGSASGVKNTMCQTRGYCLTTAEFIAARRAEQLAAIRQLAPTSHVYYEKYVDNTLTVAQATSVINKYKALYPNGSYKTMSWLDDHHDHANLGTAMRNLCNAGQIPNGDCRFEQFRRYWLSKPISGGFIAGNVNVLAAYDEYFVWNPSIGRYAIGSQSVPTDFDAAYADPRTKYHTTRP